jgi:hypothetical protein
LGGSVTGGAIGGDTLFSGFTWSGGLGNDGANGRRQIFFGASSGSGWGRGGGTLASAGCHGGFGAGGGGRGSAGGKARSFEFRASDEGPAHGGGAATNTSASVLNDVDGFGSGGGGGTGASNGGNGRRGSGGGGSGNVGTIGGSGGDGFLRIVTYCW